ncbi:MAG: stage II sporulation protein M [Armatimonadetes bacterium]|nr:stage II sporulation protein M [Armatimonadota bacterium]MDW8026907.1 stage II sporulation protein M [Armatimonadota bacterium]
MNVNRRLAEIASEKRKEREEKLNERWRELEQLIRRAQGFSIRHMKADELIKLGKLYRLAVAELARSNSSLPNRALHRLVGWGYSVIYAQPPLQRLKFWKSLAQLIWNDFPSALIAHLPFFLLAAAAIFGGAFLTCLVVLMRPEVANSWLGEELMVMLQEVAQRHKPGQDWLPLMGRPFAFWIILLNNLRVALLGYGAGIFAMVPSLWLLFVNGKIVGGAFAASYQFGTLSEFLGFVLPHGVVELPAFCIASAAGLVMGYRWLCPGDLPRLTAMVEAGRKSIPLLLASFLMLLYAAFIEAFFSPHEKIPAPAKWLFAGLEVLLLGLYFAARGLATMTKRHEKQIYRASL